MVVISCITDARASLSGSTHGRNQEVAVQIVRAALVSTEQLTWCSRASLVYFSLASQNERVQQLEQLSERESVMSERQKDLRSVIVAQVQYVSSEWP